MIVLGIFLARLVLLGGLIVFGYYDSEQRKLNENQCESIGGKYMKVDQQGKTQIWRCIK